ncbi:MAG: hypothetical protein HXX16_12670 [Bacteroidales bacterium]|nr:hypothetical protein [Bacteroidales bacterium]
MKTLKTVVILLVILFYGCERKEDNKMVSYVFVKEYSATIMVGGFVGIKDKKFNIGDQYLGKVINDSKVRIQIAIHSDRNDGPPSSDQFQEYLDVPSEYLEILKE